MGLVEAVLDIIAPFECLHCKIEGSLLCERCADMLTKVPPRCYRCGRWEDGYHTCRRCRARSPLERVCPATSYDDATAKELVHALKFGRAKGAAKSIASILATAANIPDDAYITYVPTANMRVRERGYDQAALIARELARITGRPYLPLLARMDDRRQTGKTRDTRLQQMDGAFRILLPEVIKNKHILLVDDVLTTGATCEAAARALRKAGARHVSAAVFVVA
jgi:ComF family protein